MHLVIRYFDFIHYKHGSFKKVFAGAFHEHHWIHSCLFNKDRSSISLCFFWSFGYSPGIRSVGFYPTGRIAPLCPISHRTENNLEVFFRLLHHSSSASESSYIRTFSSSFPSALTPLCSRLWCQIHSMLVGYHNTTVDFTHWQPRLTATAMRHETQSFSLLLFQTGFGERSSQWLASNVRPFWVLKGLQAYVSSLLKTREMAKMPHREGNLHHRDL